MENNRGTWKHLSNVGCCSLFILFFGGGVAVFIYGLINFRIPKLDNKRLFSSLQHRLWETKVGCANVERKQRTHISLYFWLTTLWIHPAVSLQQPCRELLSFSSVSLAGADLAAVPLGSKFYLTWVLPRSELIEYTHPYRYPSCTCAGENIDDFHFNKSSS